jgi:hypothetical protein
MPSAMLTTSLLILATVAACSESGQLAQTSLSAPCAAGDTACTSGQNEGVTSPIAAGATLALEVKPAIAGGPAVPLTLRTVDPLVATIDDAGRVRAVGPGITAVLVLTDDGGLVDVTHVSVAKAERVSFHRGGGGALDERQLPARIELFPEEELTLSLRVWQSGQQLIGEMGDVWSVDDDAFKVLDQGFALERRIKAPASGTTTLLVDVLGVQQTLILEVVP